MRKHRIVQIAVITILSGFVLSVGPGCRKDQQLAPPVDSTYYNRIKFVVQNNADYKAFVTALPASLLDTLATPGPFTLLLSKGPRQDPAYQIWPGARLLGTLPAGLNQEIPTLAGTPAYVSKYAFTNGGVNDTVVTVNGVNVTRADIHAANGLIHIMDYSPAALEYATLDDILQARPETRLLAIIFQRVNLRSILQGAGPYTLLAPTTTAFTSDASFTWLPLKTADDVYAADSTKLAAFAKNLIVPGRLFVNDFFMNWLINGQNTYTTLGGEAVTVSVTPDNSNPLRFGSVGFSGQGNNSPINLTPDSSSGNVPVKNGVLLLLPQVLSPN